MFSETRYALNGDLNVAYRASREGARDIVSVANWFGCCEILPELPSLQGWVEAMTSIGRLIFFDQPGTGASDPVSPGAWPTLEQWADSITAVLDDLGSREAVLIAIPGALPAAALFAATHPSRTTALVALGGNAAPLGIANLEEVLAAFLAAWGTGEYEHVLNPDMPWNEEVRASWARMERLAASPRTRALMVPLVAELDVRAVLPTIRVPTLVVNHTDDMFITPAQGEYVAEHIPDAKYVGLPGRNMWHFVEPWRASFREIAEFLTGRQAAVPDDRVLATVLFTDIVDSTRRAAEIGDRDWCAMTIRGAVRALGIEVRAGLHTGECEVRGDDIGGIAVHIGARVGALAGPNEVLVSSTLRDLVIGSGLEFDDRGTHDLKGVPGQWRLFAVAA